MAAAGFSKDDEVYVFYRMTKRCLPHRKYFAVMDPRQGSYRPRTGVSDGWVPARVVEVKGDDVCVGYSWPYFFTQRGHMADSSSGWTEWYGAGDVRKATGASQGARFPEPATQPDLALITFRWGGFNEVIAPGQWGETGSSVSDIFIDSFVDMAVLPKLGNNFEVWTVYVEDRGDLAKLADSAHLIFGPNHPAMRAKHTCAMYHLYPTGFEENCVPNKETGEDGGAALVDSKSLFRCIQAVERAGIPTRFPHPSGFYELLTSKRWTYMMALTPSLRVPPTIAMPRMLIERGCAFAAKKGMLALQSVKNQQAKLRNETKPVAPITKGVAKLGYSWEALDVKFWEEENGLKEAIYQLTQTIEISQEITGQPHDLESIIIQEYCKHDLELRLYVVEGKVESAIYTKFCRIKENLEFGDFKELFDSKEAAKQWMGNDTLALQDGERQCREITDQWLVWVEAQLSEQPPAIRFDFFVGRTGIAGQAQVWTLEICELGFSMLGAKDLPQKVFRAMLRSMLGESQGAAESNAPPQQAAIADTERAEPVGQAISEAIDAAAGDSSSAGAADEPDEDLPVPPQFLQIVIPSKNMTEDQLVCAGKYKMMPRREANGYPIWEHVSRKRWLYYGNDDFWYVGDEEELRLKFDCEQGYIRHEGEEFTFPTALSGHWERGPDWTPDPVIVVSEDGKPRKDDDASKGKGKAKGKNKNRK